MILNDKVLIIIIASITFFSCSFFQEDPRLIKNHHTILVVGKDSIKINRLLKMEVNGDTIPLGQTFLSSKQLSNILLKLTGIATKDTLVSSSLYVDFSDKKIEKWTITEKDIKALSYYFVENDSLKFNYYDVRDRKTETFGNLSGGYCNVSVAFLQDNKNIKNKALINLNLKLTDLPDKKKLKLSSKKADVLYQKMQQHYNLKI